MAARRRLPLNPSESHACPPPRFGAESPSGEQRLDEKRYLGAHEREVGKIARSAARPEGTAGARRETSRGFGARRRIGP
jgi:hypothetical protein